LSNAATSPTTSARSRRITPAGSVRTASPTAAPPGETQTCDIKFNLRNAKIHLKATTRYGSGKQACGARCNPLKTLGEIIIYIIIIIIIHHHPSSSSIIIIIIHHHPSSSIIIIIHHHHHHPSSSSSSSIIHHHHHPSSIIIIIIHCRGSPHPAWSVAQ
jgi:hypothetical protein